MYIYVYIYAHIHAYIYMYIHTYTLTSPASYEVARRPSNVTANCPRFITTNDDHATYRTGTGIKPVLWKVV